MTHCPQICVRKKISRPGSRRKSIQCSTLYRLTSSFFALRKYFDTHFWGQCVSCHARGCMVGYMGRISHTSLKNRIMIYRNRSFEKLHRTIAYWFPVRSETGFVILCKFWSRFDLWQRRNRKFLGYDQGFLSERTVQS